MAGGSGTRSTRVSEAACVWPGYCVPEPPEMEAQADSMPKLLTWQEGSLPFPTQPQMLNPPGVPRSEGFPGMRDFQC